MANQITTLRMGQEKKRTPVGDLPIDWGLAAIREIAEVNPEVLRENTSPDATFRYIDISSIESPGVISSTREVTFGTAPSRARRIVKCGDILVSTVRPYLRAFALVTSKETNLVASTGFAVIRPKSGIEGKYLWQHVLGDAFVKFLESRMTGSNYPAVNPSDVAEALIALPPPPEQLRIADILSSVDFAIDEATVRLTKIIGLSNELTNRLLSRGVGHVKFKDTAVGSIPAAWKVVPLKSIAQIERGKFQHRPRNEPRFYGGKYPFVQTGEVTNSGGRIRGYTQTLNEEGLAISRLFPKGTILITIAANIGETAIAEFDVAFPDSLIGIVVHEGVDNRFLEYYLRARKGHLSSLATQSAQKNINLETLRPYPVSLPPYDEQVSIADKLDAISAWVLFERDFISKLKELKAGLMTILMAGKVRV